MASTPAKIASVLLSAGLTAGLLLGTGLLFGTSPAFAADDEAPKAGAAKPAAAQPAPAKVAAPASEAPAEEPAPDPGPDMMRYPPSSARIGLIAGGVGILGLAYGLTALCATTWPEVPGSDAMLVPVVGPLGALVQSGCASDDPDCGAMLVLRTMLLVVDAMAQLGGAGIIGEGIFMTTEADAPDSARWMLMPTVAPGQAGLGAIGTF